MTLADDLDARVPSTLTLDSVLDALEDNDRAALERALTDRDGKNYRWSAPALSKRLQEDGWNVSKDTIRAWRSRRDAS